MLSSERDSENEENNKEVSSFISLNQYVVHQKRIQKVTIVTCHAAKGLEWPVVFVPAGNILRRHNQSISQVVVSRRWDISILPDRRHRRREVRSCENGSIIPNDDCLGD
jgi:superfamily I DNA/RNA helicase